MYLEGDFMDKKGHAYIAGFIRDNIKILDNKDYGWDCLFGSLTPDFRLSFIKIRHTKDNTLEIFKDKMVYISNNFNEINKDFSNKISEAIHYICDFFTYPHNPNRFNGNFFDHIFYERRQHIEVLKYIKDKEYLKDYEKFKFDDCNLEDVFNKINTYHLDYLKQRPSIENDCKYILGIVFCFLIWVLLKICNLSKLEIEEKFF